MRSRSAAPIASSMRSSTVTMGAHSTVSVSVSKRFSSAAPTKTFGQNSSSSQPASNEHEGQPKPLSRISPT